MAIGNGNTVWILGAGFSRSLGGPLLADLFRPRAIEDDEALFPKDKYPNLSRDLNMTRCLFCAGQDEGRWDNAEQFLSYMDGAYGTDRGHQRTILKNLEHRLLNGPRNHLPLCPSILPGFPGQTLVDEYQRIAKRAFAAQIAEFLLDIHDDDERWRPYKQWCSTLEPNRDTIITLNYDLVLEKLGGTRLSIVMPRSANRDKVRVLKLHGSIDWQEVDGSISYSSAERLLASEDSVPLIAAPGRSKTAAVGTTLKPLWDMAIKALQQADAIVMLGYSFPQTDAGARMDLLGAIGGASPSCFVRRIDIVMGPDTARADTRRVQALAEACRNGRFLTDRQPRKILSGPESGDRYLLVQVWPLGAEDFIADYTMRLRDFRCDG
jgi:hypothetical protein